jgi:hypothetical protein
MTIAMAILALCLNGYTAFESANAHLMLWLALLFAGAMAFVGDRLYSIVVWIVSVANIVFLSTGIREHFVAALAGRDHLNAAVSAFCLALPLLCWMLVKPEPRST